MRALAREREGRYATARELQVALEERGPFARAGHQSTAAHGRVDDPHLRARSWSRGSAAPVDRSAEVDSSSEPTNLIRPPTLDRGPALADLPDPDGSVTTPRSGAAVASWRRRIAAAGHAGRGGGGRLHPHRPAGVSVHGRATGPAPVAAQRPEPGGHRRPEIVAVHRRPPLRRWRRGRPAPPEARPAALGGRPAACARRKRPSSSRRRSPARSRSCSVASPRSPRPRAQAPQMFVRFQVAMNGEVTAADVLPTELAGTALGRCLAQVARSAQFGPQASPVAVRIPVTRAPGGGVERTMKLHEPAIAVTVVDPDAGGAARCPPGPRPRSCPIRARRPPLPRPPRPAPPAPSASPAGSSTAVPAPPR